MIDIDDLTSTEPTATDEPAEIASAPAEPSEPADRRHVERRTIDRRIYARRTRRGFMMGLMVIVMAWAAGLGGAWMGVRLAESKRPPARVASTLGLVEVPPRTSPLPSMDVFTVASAVAPSVVHVSATIEKDGLRGESTGSGVTLTADGEIVTNAHVVEGALTVSVRIPGETEPRGAVVVAIDSARDLALLHIDAEALVPAEFAAPGDVRVGDDVVVVGYALDLDGDPSVTVGIVSALDRTSDSSSRALKGLIQTDAPISSGNSGGPLVNSLGQVIGLATFVALSEGGTTANSVGFAISNAELLPAIERLRDSTTGALPTDGYLGVGLSDRVDGGAGAVVTEVADGSPAAGAGLEVGDVIVTVDGDDITGRAGLIATIRDHAPGDEVTIGLRRAGEPTTVRVTLTSRPAG